VIELPWYPDAIMFRPGRPEKAMAGAVPLGKEAITLRSALLLGTCTNEKCGEELEIMLDQRNDGTVLTSKREFFSMLEKKLEPRDSGRGSLIGTTSKGLGSSASQTARAVTPTSATTRGLGSGSSPSASAFPPPRCAWSDAGLPERVYTLS
jgi:hypothetical protein